MCVSPESNSSHIYKTLSVLSPFPIEAMKQGRDRVSKRQGVSIWLTAGCIRLLKLLVNTDTFTRAVRADTATEKHDCCH